MLACVVQTTLDPASERAWRGSINRARTRQASLTR
jgi:hypothetical protein